MGAFNSQQRPPIRLENEPGWDAGEWIQVKGVVTAADIKAITTQQVSIGPDGKPLSISDTDMVAALQCMIEEWMLLGDNNVPVALYDGRRKRTEVIAKLPTEYMTPVMNAIGSLMNKAKVQQPKDFTTSASEPIQEPSTEESESQTNS
jgi:hypothetical protein